MKNLFFFLFFYFSGIKPVPTSTTFSYQLKWTFLANLHVRKYHFHEYRFICEKRDYNSIQMVVCRMSNGIMNYTDIISEPIDRSLCVNIFTGIHLASPYVLIRSLFLSWKKGDICICFVSVYLFNVFTWRN